MAKKATQARLTIPIDIWNISKFDNYDKKSFGFFISNDSRVVIANDLVCRNLNYEFLGRCSFDEKHRFFVPKNVDAYLGSGDIYYFTSSIESSIIYFYKTSNDSLSKLQNYHLNLLIDSLGE